MGPSVPPHVLQICRQVAQQMAATFTGADAGIVWLTFEQCMLEETILLIEANKARQELGAVHDDTPQEPLPPPAPKKPAASADPPTGTPAASGSGVDGAGGGSGGDGSGGGAAQEQEAEVKIDPKTVKAAYLAPPIQLSPIDNPLAIAAILENERAKERSTMLAGSNDSKHVLRGVLRALELIHRRWMLSINLWEVEVLEKATHKWTLDYNLQGPQKKTGNHSQKSALS